MARGAPSGQHAELLAAITPVVAAAGYDLEDLTVVQAGRRSLVRVVVDGDQGISLDNIAAVSREISAALDDGPADATVGRQPYTLEVTSPGVDRPLTLPRHWQRNVGRLVTTTVQADAINARVVAADAEGVSLDVDGRQVQCPYAELGAGRVQIEFTRPAGSDSTDGDTDGADFAGGDTDEGDEDL
jgi:ribosome maturation factor RimP